MAYHQSMPHGGLTLRVANCPEGCAELLSYSLALARHSVDVVQSSIKEFTVLGYPAVEYEAIVDDCRPLAGPNCPKTVKYERLHSVNKRLYLFSAHWPQNESQPADLRRTLDSFRLLEK